VVDNVADVDADQVDKTPSNHVKTPVTEVLAVKVIRKPTKTPTTPTLPHTGIPAQQATFVALLLLVIGTALSMVRRRRG
jgi:LPXTG-motif cell wall-anchored protein